MTVRNGLFVRPDDVRGTSPVEARLALAGMFDAPGVLRGGTVTGTSGWNYSVAAFAVVSQRTEADGVVLFANDSAVLVPTDAAPGTGSRIDIVYARHNDVDNGDATSEAVVEVAVGEPAGSPTAPTIPEGAVELARATVAAGATGTNHANVTISRADVTQAALAGTPLRFDTEAAMRALVPSPTDGQIARTGTGSTLAFWAAKNGTWQDILAVIGGDADWVTCTPNAGFALHATRPAQVCSIGRVIYARGGFTGAGFVAGSNNGPGTIPSGFRPGQETFFIPIANQIALTGGRAYVEPNGKITIGIGAGTIAASYEFPGMSWPRS